MIYKLRAESSNDIALFIQKAHNVMANFTMQRDLELPDVDFEFETELTLDKIVLILKEMADSHVMYETVKPLAEYTGERNYHI